MNFDEMVEQRGSGSVKWDAIERFCGLTAEDAIPMWIAQMDFAPAPFLTRAAQALATRGQYGYFVGVEQMFERVAWWSETRYGAKADPAHMRATHGLGNGIGLCLQVYSEPGDEVVIFTPVYHEFAAKIGRNGRVVKESPLARDADGRWHMDLDALEQSLSGRERIVIISAPHNPAGRIWTAEELTALGDFCARHDLVLFSDEIHADLVFPGHAHVTALAAIPQHADRLVVMMAASKTFDIAGLRTSTVIIPDAGMRAKFDQLHRALDIQPNRMGVDLTVAAYSDEGAAWVEGLQVYLARNAKVWIDGIAEIDGLVSTPMEGTYLAWVDFSGLDLPLEEVTARLHDGARIVPSPGPALGRGGEHCHRFNIATPRARVTEAVARMQAVFG